MIVSGIHEAKIWMPDKTLGNDNILSGSVMTARSYVASARSLVGAFATTPIDFLFATICVRYIAAIALVMGFQKENSVILGQSKGGKTDTSKSQISYHG